MDDIAIYCDSLLQAKDCLRYLDSLGFEWYSGDNLLTWSVWEDRWNYGIFVIKEHKRISYTKNTTIEELDSYYQNHYKWSLGEFLFHMRNEHVMNNVMDKDKGEEKMNVEELKLPETLMDTSVTYELTEEEKQDLKKEMADLLLEFGYKYPNSAFVITDEWVEQKGWMIKLFSKHPNYIKGKFMFEINPELQRYVDKNLISKFRNWFEVQLLNFAENNQAKIGFFGIWEYADIKNDLYEKGRKLESFLDLYDYSEVHYPTKDEYYTKIKSVRIDLLKEYQRMSKKMEDAFATTKDVTVNGCTYTLPKEIGWKIIQVNNLLDYVLPTDYLTTDNQTPHLFTEGETNRIKDYFTCEKERGREIDYIRIPQVGEKKTRFILKLAKLFDINKVTDIKEIKWVDQSGVEHSRTVDEGWNKQFAEFSDAITPRTYTEKWIISCNLIDYYTMSFLNDTSSCMTIDKKNQRGVSDSGHNYQGMYSSGTESYMLDKVTFLAYHPASSIEGEENLPYELKTKQRRCMFHMGEDKLVQGRLYPDGRTDDDNGTDESKQLYDQLREIVQREIAQLLETPNLWLNKKGTDKCHNVSVSIGNHYRDYESYGECNVSYLRRIDGLLNENKITIGHKTICPVCGKEHRGHPGTSRDNIQCDDCRQEHSCRYCGCIVDTDCAIEIDGNYYCCTSCAEEDGYVDTVDDGWHIRSNCSWDDWEEAWYYDDTDGVRIEDNWYHDEETAERAGYRWSDYDDDWVYEDDSLTMPNGDVFNSYRNDEYVRTSDGYYFPNDDEAIEHGYILDEDTGEYVKEEAA